MEDYEELARRGIPRVAPDADVELFSLAYNLLHVSYQLINDLEGAVHRPRGLTLPGFRLLFKLWLLGPTMPARLAELSKTSRAAVTNAVHTLERAGFVERRPSATDRRAVPVALTPKGEVAVREVFELQAAREASWFAGLDAGERASLTELLRRVAASQP
ncbi:MarR family transcriptional regulator [Actinocorallia sp. A-T 12471]|uniref:MarR family winged helix-turn-helix transcriptional regulator n=1 Tax=Actinocorallia sp. A-T 12471 TaxID=3089813 RepID=UPI0029CB7E3E|nr:MarR family transcriptional regulator [Actinocorallia sp. A-T 12471]MDX6741264.1 MarR family transcriptional regulator [Actinocorallia sp. A-T 12471]